MNSVTVATECATVLLWGWGLWWQHAQDQNRPKNGGAEEKHYCYHKNGSDLDTRTLTNGMKLR